ncbi:sugar ABC transporter permease [Amycolatopsis sp. PS_44_ISF1]|uniref:carbohydrate ABC transporter permease n=1 Tax=Amycolatopsis sp. PS_44_ISF1 TaxID=2974917 RepID=UPI0028DE874C|nr:sugar ABC transporter permease [Amycolatopsis sp. PS_44_ISF1]MDT8913634.1 sugar ABC transporter permease [Amycolatopsis sp. PS_44_ISF1]
MTALVTRPSAPPRPRHRKRGRGTNALERQRRRMFWPFVGPALIVYGLLFLAPIAYSAWTSLFKWDGLGDMQWRGLGNYGSLVQDPVFRTSVTNTLKILVIGGGLTFVVAFALTLALRELKSRMFARSVLFFPCLINALVFGAAAGFLFNPDGPVNAALRAVGVTTPPRWLATDNLFTLILCVLVWSSAGYYTTIIMAAVDQIPGYLYEAAELDGAGGFRRFWHVTLPLAWDVVTVCAVLWTVSSVKVFELVLLFGGGNAGNPPAETWTTAVYVYATAFPQNSAPKLGLASAAALVSLVLVGLFTLLLRRIMRREPIED